MLLLIGLALSACGGTSHAAKQTTTVTNDPASVQAFVSAANNVCMTADKRIYKLGRLTRAPKGWARTAAEARQAIGDMEKVKPPPDRAQSFNLMMRYAKGLALSIQEVHDALVKKNIDVAAAAQFAAAHFQDKVHSTAKGLGLTFCQQPLTNWPA